MYNNLKIGYVPYNTDLSHPDDRRRFPYFAKRNDVQFEIADSKKDYDIILLPAPANLTKWLMYKKRHPNTRFIFEMVDSLIYQLDSFNTLFKGVGRFVIGKESLPSLKHKEILIKWLKVADMVVCSSQKIKQDIEQYNSNITVSLDYLQHEYKFLKTDYSIKGKMKLLWEGQGVIVPHFLHFKEMFKKVSSFCELHVVTSETFPKYGPFVKKDVATYLQQLPIETHFHKWDLNTNSTLFSQLDCGIIPLNKENAYGWHKPANKLISFWFSGMPTLTSDTPAYIDATSQTNTDMLCGSQEEWVEKLHAIRNMNKEAREKIAHEHYEVARAYYSNETHDSIWINIFEKMKVGQFQKSHIIRPEFARPGGFWEKSILLNK